MAKSNKTGRSTGEGKHVRDYEWMLESPAYRSLPCYARALLTQLKRLFNGGNNGDLYLSVRDAGALIGACKDTASKAFDDLEERGFIRKNLVGSFAWKKGKATTWILEEFPLGEQLPTKRFMHWKAPPDASRMRNIRDGKIRTRSHRIDEVSDQTANVSCSADTTDSKAREVSATSDSSEQNDLKSVLLDRTHIVTRQSWTENSSALVSLHVAGVPETNIAQKLISVEAPAKELVFESVGAPPSNF